MGHNNQLEFVAHIGQIEEYFANQQLLCRKIFVTNIFCALQNFRVHWFIRISFQGDCQ